MGRGHFADAVTRSGRGTPHGVRNTGWACRQRDDEPEWRSAALAAEYVARTDRLAPLFPRARPLPAHLPDYPPRLPDYPPHLPDYPPRLPDYPPRLPDYPPRLPDYPPPAAPLPHPDLASELQRSLLYAPQDHHLWNGKPQQYFESMHYGERPPHDADYDSDSLQP
ncbi:hypothetical protein B5X24_HaOG205286 [Helicoverpa armigera]|uniref:Uncharacterized protein n=1 Tax=Helicoverpa armigera TaxID=29058 RepID=A0A2W1BQS0_HELAM|nr:hypothetical protein B5X24_HaOG205286 [Helicoverpa armigera]